MHRRTIPHYKYNRRKTAPSPKWSAERQAAEIKKIITEDTNTHMQIQTKERMPDELKTYDNLAYTFPPYITIGIIAFIFFLFLYLVY